MAVTYTKGNSNWQNSPNLTTPITEDKLDNFETGIDQIYGLVSAKGDLISGSSSRNLVATTVGANDRVLVADSAQTGGIKWVQLGMGQLATGVGTNDTVLVADSGQAAGMKWVQVGNSQVIANAEIALSKLASGAWDTYTPTLTATVSNPTLGSGSSVVGRYIKQGRRTMHVHVEITFGTSGAAAGTGNYIVSLPEARVAGTNGSDGYGYLYDVSANALYPVVTTINTTTSLFMWTTAAGVIVGAPTPFTWAITDRIVLKLTYETAA